MSRKAIAPARGQGLRWFLGGALLALVGAGWGCSSLSKEDLEVRLAALGKNAAVSPRRTARVRFEHAGEPVELDLVYTLRTAREPTPGRRPIVLLHGTPSTLFSWAELTHGGPGFEGLARERDVWALEIVGHGVAPGDPDALPPFGFELCARFVDAALDSLGLADVHVVGSSYGGEFGWRAALNEPERFASLVLIDSSGYSRRDQDWLPEEIAMRENPLAQIGWRLNSRDRIRGALEPHFRTIPPDRVEEFYLVCSNADNWSAMVDLCRDENGTRQDEIADLARPTLVLWGADDRAYDLDVYGRRFASDIPDARLVVLEETGHYPHEERPARVVEELNRFFADVEAR